MAKRLISLAGKVLRRNASELDADRYTYLSLEQAEPNPGNPTSDGSLFFSDADGTRGFTKEPRVHGLAFDDGNLNEADASRDYALILNTNPTDVGDDSVGYRQLGDLAFTDESEITLQTVTESGNTTDQGITLLPLGSVVGSTPNSYALDISEPNAIRTLNTTTSLFEGDVNLAGTTFVTGAGGLNSITLLVKGDGDSVGFRDFNFTNFTAPTLQQVTEESIFSDPNSSAFLGANTPTGLRARFYKFNELPPDRNANFATFRKALVIDGVADSVGFRDLRDLALYDSTNSDIRVNKIDVLNPTEGTLPGSGTVPIVKYNETTKEYEVVDIEVTNLDDTFETLHSVTGRTEDGMDQGETQNPVIFNNSITLRGSTGDYPLATKNGTLQVLVADTTDDSAVVGVRTADAIAFDGSLVDLDFVLNNNGTATLPATFSDALRIENTTNLTGTEPAVLALGDLDSVGRVTLNTIAFTGNEVSTLQDVTGRGDSTSDIVTLGGVTITAEQQHGLHIDSSALGSSDTVNRFLIYDTSSGEGVVLLRELDNNVLDGDDTTLQETTERGRTTTLEIIAAGFVGDSATVNELNVNTDATIASLAVTDLTTDQVVIVGASGELEGDANFTFDGTILNVGANLDVTGITTLDSTTVNGRLIVDDDDVYLNGALLHGEISNGFVNFGMGTNTPTFTSGRGLEIERLSPVSLRLDNAGDNVPLEITTEAASVNIRGIASVPMQFYTGDLERLRIDADGDLNALNNVDVSGNFDVAGLTTLDSTTIDGVGTILVVNGETELDATTVDGTLDVNGVTTLDSTTIDAGVDGFRIQNLSAATSNTTLLSIDGDTVFTTTFDNLYDVPTLDAVTTVGNLTNNEIYASGFIGDSASVPVLRVNDSATIADLHVTSLPQNQIVYPNADAKLVSDANLTWNGATLAVTGDVDFNGNADILDDLTVGGVANLDSTNVVGTLDVTGISTLDSTNINGGLNLQNLVGSQSVTVLTVDGLGEVATRDIQSTAFDGETLQSVTERGKSTSIPMVLTGGLTLGPVPATDTQTNYNVLVVTDPLGDSVEYLQVDAGVFDGSSTTLDDVLANDPASGRNILLTGTGGIEADSAEFRSDVQITGDFNVDGITTMDSATVRKELVVLGNLRVEGATTVVNTTELVVSDKNIELADGSTDKNDADGGGITLDLGTDGAATITYNAGTDDWNLNKALYVDSDLDVDGDTQLNGNLDVVGTGTFDGNVDIAGNLDVNGLTTLDSTTIDAGPNGLGFNIGNIATTTGNTDVLTINGGVVTSTSFDDIYSVPPLQDVTEIGYVTDRPIHAQGFKGDSAQIAGNLNVDGLTTLDSTQVEEMDVQGNLIVNGGYSLLDSVYVDGSLNLTNLKGAADQLTVLTIDTQNEVGTRSIQSTAFTGETLQTVTERGKDTNIPVELDGGMRVVTTDNSTSAADTVKVLTQVIGTDSVESRTLGNLLDIVTLDYVTDHNATTDNKVTVGRLAISNLSEQPDLLQVLAYSNDSVETTTLENTAHTALTYFTLNQAAQTGSDALARRVAVSEAIDLDGGFTAGLDNPGAPAGSFDVIRLADVGGTDSAFRVTLQSGATQPLEDFTWEFVLSNGDSTGPNDVYIGNQLYIKRSSLPIAAPYDTSLVVPVFKPSNTGVDFDSVGVRTLGTAANLDQGDITLQFTTTQGLTSVGGEQFAVTSDNIKMGKLIADLPSWQGLSAPYGTATDALFRASQDSVGYRTVGSFAFRDSLTLQEVTNFSDGGSASGFGDSTDKDVKVKGFRINNGEAFFIGGNASNGLPPLSTDNGIVWDSDTQQVGYRKLSEAAFVNPTLQVVTEEGKNTTIPIVAQGGLELTADPLGGTENLTDPTGSNFYQMLVIDTDTDSVKRGSIGNITFTVSDETLGTVTARGASRSEDNRDSSTSAVEFKNQDFRLSGLLGTEQDTLVSINTATGELFTRSVESVSQTSTLESVTTQGNRAQRGIGVDEVRLRLGQVAFDGGDGTAFTGDYPQVLSVVDNQFTSVTADRGTFDSDVFVGDKLYVQSTDPRIASGFFSVYDSSQSGKLTSRVRTHGGSINTQGGNLILDGGTLVFSDFTSANRDHIRYTDATTGAIDPPGYGGAYNFIADASIGDSANALINAGAIRLTSFGTGLNQAIAMISEGAVQINDSASVSGTITAGGEIKTNDAVSGFSLHHDEGGSNDIEYRISGGSSIFSINQVGTTEFPLYYLPSSKRVGVFADANFPSYNGAIEITRDVGTKVAIENTLPTIFEDSAIVEGNFNLPNVTEQSANTNVLTVNGAGLVSFTQASDIAPAKSLQDVTDIGNTTDNFMRIRSSDGGPNAYFEILDSGSNPDLGYHFLAGATSFQQFETNEEGSSVLNAKTIIEAEDSDATTMSIIKHGNTVGAPSFILAKNRGTSKTTKDTVVTGDDLGRIIFAGASNPTSAGEQDPYSPAMEISSQVTSVGGQDQISSALRIFDHSTGAKQEIAEFTSIGEFSTREAIKSGNAIWVNNRQQIDTAIMYMGTTSSTLSGYISTVHTPGGTPTSSMNFGVSNTGGGNDRMELAEDKLQLKSGVQLQDNAGSNLVIYDSTGAVLWGNT